MLLHLPSTHVEQIVTNFTYITYNCWICLKLETNLITMVNMWRCYVVLSQRFHPNSCIYMRKVWQKLYNLYSIVGNLVLIVAVKNN